MGHMSYHPKRIQLIVMLNGTYELSFQKGPAQCHVKWDLLGITPKGSAQSHAE